MQKIFIIGNGGAGKTTMARKLSEAMDLPVIHLDHIAWEPGWAKRTETEFTQKLDKILPQPAWIMEGWSFTSTISQRIYASDVVIFLDIPLWKCYWNVIRRHIKYRFKPGPYNTQGVSHLFLYMRAMRIIHHQQIPQLRLKVSECEKNKKVYVFNSIAAANLLVNKLKYGQRLRVSWWNRL